MRRKTAGRVHHQRECAYCHGGIAEQRPVFLVADEAGKLTGPFHAGCAAKLVALHKGKSTVYQGVGDNLGLLIPKPREETLPW